MDKVRVGVIGVGHLGKLHATLYQQVPDAHLKGVYDSDRQKSSQIARQLNVKDYESVDHLLNDVDAVNIVTPTTTHSEIARKALEHNCHVFIEKPITATESEALQIIELSERHNKLVQVGHIERFNAALLALEDVPLHPIFIEAHRLASFNPRGTDVAVVLDLMIHDIDLILHLVKSNPVKIAASGVGVISSTIDIANARIEFENGCVANVTASRISNKKMRKMRVFQKNAYISMDFADGFSEIFYIPDEKQTPFHDGTMAFSLGQINFGEHSKEIKYNRLERQNVNPLKRELSSFTEAIHHNRPAVVTAREGLAALRLANSVLQEIDNHQRLVQSRPSFVNSSQS